MTVVFYQYPWRNDCVGRPWSMDLNSCGVMTWKPGLLNESITRNQLRIESATHATEERCSICYMQELVCMQKGVIRDAS
jgi:hypothetical protein